MYWGTIAFYGRGDALVLPILPSFSRSGTQKTVLNIRNLTICTGTTGAHPEASEGEEGEEGSGVLEVALVRALHVVVPVPVSL